MALQITQIRDMFVVMGELNGTNIEILNRHMKRHIRSGYPVTLNLERIKGMDAIATKVIQQMVEWAMYKNSRLSVQGLGTEQIMPMLNRVKTA